MAFQWTRRVLLALAPAALLALAGCGSGSIESQFRPSRMVAFGDALTDMGNKGTRYSVNDTNPVWVQVVASDYGITIDKSASGGTDYAQGNARIVLKPDAAGSNATPTIKEQIDAYLAAGGTFGAGDLVVIEGGYSDLIVQMQAYRSGTLTSDQLLANVRQAANDMADQAKRLTAAGASHVAVLGVYDLSRTPWGVNLPADQKTLLSNASIAFDNALLIALVDEGNKMLYVDVPLLFNFMTSNPPGYALNDVTTAVCNSVDAGPGIGVGAGEVNSALCTIATIPAGVDYATYLWADPVYPTPAGHRRLGDDVYSRLHNRW